MTIFLTGTPGPGWYSKVFGEISTTKTPRTCNSCKRLTNSRLQANVFIF